VSRKYDPNPSCGKSTARPLVPTPLSPAFDPVAWLTASRNTSAGSRRAEEGGKVRRASFLAAVGTAGGWYTRVVAGVRVSCLDADIGGPDALARASCPSRVGRGVVAG